jgi:MFS family permease
MPWIKNQITSEEKNIAIQDKSTPLYLRPSFRRRVPVVIMAVAAAYAVFIHFSTPIYPYDDAYITFRHAENFFHGKGFVYNPGQRVFGVSTPLYAVWLVVLRCCTPWAELPLNAVRANAVLFIAAGLGIFFLVRRYTLIPWIATAAAAAFLTNRFLLDISIGGMEPFLFVALSSFSLLAASHRRPAAFGILASLAMFARPEGAVLLPIGLLVFIKYRFLPDWRPIARAVAAWSAPLLVWMVVATAYWGSPLPHSIKAKAVPVYPVPAGEAARDIINLLGKQLSLHNANALPARGFFLFIPVLAGLIAALAVPSFRRRQAYAPALCFLAMFTAYSFGNPLLFPWYYPKLYVGAVLAILVGASSILSLIRSNARPAAAFWARLVISAAVVLWLSNLAMLPVANGKPLLRSPAADAADDPVRARISSYIEAARWLNERSTEKTSAAASEMGALGFYFKGKILDGNGLVSPEALPFLPVPPEQRLSPRAGALSVDFVRTTMPEWVVTMEVFSCKSLDVSDWFRANYELARSIDLPKETFGNKDIRIYRRRDSSSGRASSVSLHANPG